MQKIEIKYPIPVAGELQALRQKNADQGAIDAKSMPELEAPRFPYILGVCEYSENLARHPWRRVAAGPRQQSASVILVVCLPSQLVANPH